MQTVSPHRLGAHEAPLFQQVTPVPVKPAIIARRGAFIKCFILIFCNNNVRIDQSNIRPALQRLCHSFTRICTTAVIGIGIGDVFPGRCPYASIPGSVNSFTLIGSYVFDVGVFFLKFFNNCFFILL